MKARRERDGTESCAEIALSADFIGVLRESKIQEGWNKQGARNSEGQWL